MYYALATGCGMVAGFVLCWVTHGQISADLQALHAKLDRIIAALH